MKFAVMLHLIKKKKKKKEIMFGKTLKETRNSSKIRPLDFEKKR